MDVVSPGAQEVVTSGRFAMPTHRSPRAKRDLAWTEDCASQALAEARTRSSGHVGWRSQHGHKLGAAALELMAALLQSLKLLLARQDGC